MPESSNEEKTSPDKVRLSEASSLESVKQEEVHSVLKDLLGDVQYDVAHKLEDENGLYLLDVTIPQEDGYVEYSYRKGRPENNELPGYRIDKTFYDSAGMPISGYSVAQKVSGVWKLTP